MDALKETLLRSDFDSVRQHPKYKVGCEFFRLGRGERGTLELVHRPTTAVD